jgi:hypothetical protein
MSKNNLKLQNDGASLSFIVYKGAQAVIVISDGSAQHFKPREDIPPATYTSISSDDRVVFFQDHGSGLVPVKDPIQVSLFVLQLSRITAMNNKNENRRIANV